MSDEKRPYLTFDRFILDTGGHALFDSGGDEVRLTRGEFALLLALARRAGLVLSRDQLLDSMTPSRGDACDAQKHVWIVDDHTHAIYKFTNDGKQLVQTIGTPNVAGADATHFNRPTFMAWLPDGTFYVADGYNGTRVAKFDASGKFLLDFGQSGEPGKETRPGYMNNVHGVAVDVPQDAEV